LKIVQEHLALGETPNIAARLQGLAQPDTLVISGVTARLVHSALVVEELGSQSRQGVEEPMAVARVLGLVEEQSAEEEEALPAGMPFLVCH
jgi:class 3 adenylate cyclase